MNWLRKLFRRKPKALLTYTSYTGIKINVSAVVCNTCKNYFFVSRADIEQPRFCPYCGTNFSGALEITNQESIDELLV